MSSDNPTPNRRRRILLIVVFTLLGIGVFVALVAMSMNLVFSLPSTDLDVFATVFGGPTCDPANPDADLRLAGIDLPPSAANLAVKCPGTQGIWVDISFDMQPADLEAFVSSTNVKPPLSTTGKPSKPECQCPEMQTVTSYLYGVYEEAQWFEEILIDTRQPDTWHVYFTLLAG
jgi:hypothetical protein